MKKLFCLALAWMMTNGWAYLTVLICPFPMLKKIAAAYLAILWLPFTPEKIVTVTIAIWLMKRL